MNVSNFTIALNLESSVPEIQRTSLAHVVLLLKGVGVRDVLGFEFLEAPSREQVEQASVFILIFHTLCCLILITHLYAILRHSPYT
ncbi:hypothetical protein EON63_24630 [archaeon]|nr:MAG: hypothetical protein EON63_24630 [archaeon]